MWSADLCVMRVDKQFAAVPWQLPEATAKQHCCMTSKIAVRRKQYRYSNTGTALRVQQYNNTGSLADRARCCVGSQHSDTAIASHTWQADTAGHSAHSQAL